jgi:hypothetical protein
MAGLESAPMGSRVACAGCGEELGVLERMRELSRTREQTRAQSEVVALAFCGYNLLLRGPVNSGKRWIARRAGDLLSLRRHGGRKVETVEIMSKWFTVNALGQIILDEGSLAVAMEQIQRATVLIIENVPSHPQAAATFFALLDFTCKVERGKARRSLSGLSGLSGLPRTSCKADSPLQAPFGGLQILATQSDYPEPASTLPLNSNVNNAVTAPDSIELPTPQVLWSRPHATPPPPPPPPPQSQICANAEGKAGPSDCGAIGAGAGPGPRPHLVPRQLGLLVTTAAPEAARPHEDLFVILFR